MAAANPVGTLAFTAAPVKYVDAAGVEAGREVLD